jgi:hypothetical protein
MTDDREVVDRSGGARQSAAGSGAGLPLPALDRVLGFGDRSRRRRVVIAELGLELRAV